MTFCCLHVKLAVLFLDRVTRGYSLHCHQKALSVASPSPADRAGAPLHRPCDLCAVGFAESGAVALGHYARDLHDRESCHPSCIVGSPYLCPSLFSLELDCLGPGADRFWFHLCGRLDCFAAGDENRSRAVSGSLPPYGVSGDCSGFGRERRWVRGGGIPTQAERAKRLARADGRERNDSAATARGRIETGARNSADALAKQSAAAGGCPDCWGLATCPRSQRRLLRCDPAGRETPRYLYGGRGRQGNHRGIADGQPPGICSCLRDGRRDSRGRMYKTEQIPLCEHCLREVRYVFLCHF